MRRAEGSRATIKAWVAEKNLGGREVTVVKHTGSGLVDFVTDEGVTWTLHQENFEGAQ